MATSTLGSGTLVLAGTTSGTTTVTATAVAGTTTLTLPAATDTLVGKATTDTLTNKTLTSPTLTGVVTFDAGTAAAPAITTTGDTNTGIFFPAADTIAFAEGGAEAARFDSSGNLLVGRTSANGTFSGLQVGDTTTGKNILITSSSAGNNGLIQFRDTADANAFQVAATTTGISLYGYGSRAMQFYTNDAERARIDTSGNLLVGTTSNANGSRVRVSSSNPSSGYSLELQQTSTNGGVYYYQAFFAGSTQTGNINSNGTTTTYATSSDYRLKNTIAPMTGALAKVAALKPVTYKWNANGSDGEGFIAHELQEVFPDAVVGKKDDLETYIDDEGNEQTRPKYQSIDTSFLVATLTAAIQEQQALITQLTARITALEGAQ